MKFTESLRLRVLRFALGIKKNKWARTAILKTILDPVSLSATEDFMADPKVMIPSVIALSESVLKLDSLIKKARGSALDAENYLQAKDREIESASSADAEKQMRATIVNMNDAIVLGNRMWNVLERIQYCCDHPDACELRGLESREAMNVISQWITEAKFGVEYDLN